MNCLLIHVQTKAIRSSCLSCIKQWWQMLLPTWVACQVNYLSFYSFIEAWFHSALHELDKTYNCIRNFFPKCSLFHPVYAAFEWVSFSIGISLGLLRGMSLSEQVWICNTFCFIELGTSDHCVFWNAISWHSLETLSGM